MSRTRLSSALDAVITRAGPPAVLGYCMGGLLALALEFRPDDVRGLALFATPWDFHQPNSSTRILTAMKGPIEGAIALWGGMPVDLLQACFAAIDPGGIRPSGHWRISMPGALVCATSWRSRTGSTDEYMLAGPVAREALFGWYVENRPGRGS